MKIRHMIAAGIGAVALTGGMALAVPSATAEVVAPGGDVCPEGTTSLKIDRQPVEGEIITDGTLSVLITDVRFKADGSGEAYGFDYQADGGTVVLTFVKGGQRVSKFNTTTGLNTVLAPGGRHYQISYVNFCYTV
jgi:hypothetical protein